MTYAVEILQRNEYARKARWLERHGWTHIGSWWYPPEPTTFPADRTAASLREAFDHERITRGLTDEDVRMIVEFPR